MRAQAFVDLNARSSVTLAYFVGGVRNATRIDLLGTGRLTHFENTDHLAYADVRYRNRHGPLRELRAVLSFHASDERVEQLDCATTSGVVRDLARCASEAPGEVTRRRYFNDVVVTPGVLATASFASPQQAVRVVVGGDGYVDRVGSSRRTDAPPGFAPGGLERGNFSDGSTYLQLGAFALLETDVIGTARTRERIVASGGLRGSYFAADADAVPVAGNVRYRYGTVLGSASLRYLHKDDVSAYVSWAQGLRAPNLQETTLTGPEGGAYVIPGATVLQPERSNTLEAGVRIRTTRLRAGLAGFVTLLDDVIVRASVSAEEWQALGIDRAEVGALPVVRMANAVRGRYTGAELSLAVELAHGLTAWTQAAAVRGDVFTQSGVEEPAQKTPAPLGAGGIRLQRGLFYAEIFVRWSLAQDRLAAVDRTDLRVCEDPMRIGRLQANCVGTPGWFTVNMRAGIHLVDGLRLDVLAENLGDANYRYHGSGVPEAGIGVIAAISGHL